jgi:predicted ATPase
MNEPIVVVGACGTGKSTLVLALKARGYAARIVAQEHSAIRELWAHGGWPAALIMLDASPDIISQRRHNDFPTWLYDQQRQRLRSAQAHATLYLHTDHLAANEVEQQVMLHVHQLHIVPETKRM